MKESTLWVCVSKRKCQYLKVWTNQTESINIYQSKNNKTKSKHASYNVEHKESWHQECHTQLKAYIYNDKLINNHFERKRSNLYS